MKSSRLALLFGIALVVTGCAASHVLVGTARAPIPDEQVQVYLEPPAKYETIAMLEASDLGANGFSAQSRTNMVMTRLKAEAAKVGANGVLLSGIDTQTRYTGSVIGGVGYVVPQMNKVGKAIAIYVPSPTNPTDVAGYRPDLPSSPPPPGGEARTALVIGNARYLTSPLRTPQNDARALHATLQNLGFDVTLIENGRRRELIAAIEIFGGKLRRTGGVGLVFYAGHGVQIKGKNYLIPVDAQVQSEVSAVAETVDVELVLGTMAESGTRMNVIILDACRDNPFERRWRGGGRGLAPITASDAKGILIAYSTDPGKTAADGDGEHSPYAAALLAVLRVPHLSIEQVFKRVRQQVQEVTAGTQTPWETSNLTGDFFFSPR